MTDLSRFPNPLQNKPEPAPAPPNFKPNSYRRWQSDNLTIIDKDKEEVIFRPQPAQDSLLEFMALHYNILILKARKMGFSSEALAIAVAKFILGKNEKAVSVSFDADSAAKQLDRAKHFIKSYERINKIKIPMKYNSKTEMVYEVTTPEGESWTNTLRVGSAKATGFGRGDDITFLHITEASLDRSIEATLAAVGEATVRGAHKLIETTANGFNSYKAYWDRSVLDETGYAALFYSPEWEYSPEYVAQKRKELGYLGVQEYPMTPQEAFITSGSSYFDQEALGKYLEAAQTPTVPAPGFRRYRVFEPGEFVVVAADTAAGGLDYCAAQFFSSTHLDVPQVFHQKILATEMTPLLHTELERISDLTGVPPVVAYERNNGGVFELERLARLNKLGKYRIYQQKRGVGSTRMVSESPKLGWDTNSASRPKMLQDIKEAVDNELIGIYDKTTIAEMFSFVVVPTTTAWRAQAEQGSHDDLVMALAIVYQMFQSEPKPSTEPVYIPISQGFGGAEIGGFTL